MNSTPRLVTIFCFACYSNHSGRIVLPDVYWSSREIYVLCHPLLNLLFIIMSWLRLHHTRTQDASRMKTANSIDMIQKSTKIHSWLSVALTGTIVVNYDFYIFFFVSTSLPSFVVRWFVCYTSEFAAGSPLIMFAISRENENISTELRTMLRFVVEMSTMLRDMSFGVRCGLSEMFDSAGNSAIAVAGALAGTVNEFVYNLKFTQRDLLVYVCVCVCVVNARIWQMENNSHSEWKLSRCYCCCCWLLLVEECAPVFVWNWQQEQDTLCAQIRIQCAPEFLHIENIVFCGTLASEEEECARTNRVFNKQIYTFMCRIRVSTTAAVWIEFAAWIFFIFFSFLCVFHSLARSLVRWLGVLIPHSVHSEFVDQVRIIREK